MNIPYVEYTCSGILSAIKNNDFLIHATTWMNLENILSKISQTQEANIT